MTQSRPVVEDKAVLGSAPSVVRPRSRAGNQHGRGAGDAIDQVDWQGARKPKSLEQRPSKGEAAARARCGQTAATCGGTDVP